MKLYRVICKGYDTFLGNPIAKGVLCSVRFDSSGLIQLVSAGGHRFPNRGLELNRWELTEYFMWPQAFPCEEDK